MNQTQLIGRLTRDIELRYTNSGKTVARFTLAVNRDFKNANGDYDVDFINCTIWGKGAENLTNQVHKGSRIGIAGSIRTGSYENSQGTRVYTTEVNLNQYDLLDPRESNQGNYQPSNQQGGNQQSNQQQDNGDPFAKNGEQITIDDDSLPF